MSVRKSLAAAGFIAVGLGAGPVQAGLVGDDVKLTCSGGNIVCDDSTDYGGETMATGTVSDGDFEFLVDAQGLSGPVVEFDLGDSYIRMTNVFGQDILVGQVGGANSGPVFVFSDLDWLGLSGRIVGAEATTSDRPLGANFTLDFTDDSVTLDFDGESGVSTRIDRNEFITVSLETEHIPAPATIGRFGLGLVGLGVAARRRRRGA